MDWGGDRTGNDNSPQGSLRVYPRTLLQSYVECPMVVLGEGWMLIMMFVVIEAVFAPPADNTTRVG